MRINGFHKSCLIVTTALFASGCAVQPTGGSVTTAQKASYTTAVKPQAQPARSTPSKTTTARKKKGDDSSSTTKVASASTSASTSTSMAPVDTSRRQPVAVSGAVTSEVAVKLYN